MGFFLLLSFLDTASNYETEVFTSHICVYSTVVHMFAKVKATFGIHKSMAEANKFHLWLTIAALNLNQIIFRLCLCITI